MIKRTLSLFVAGLLAALGTSALAQVKEIPWGTAAVGSSGHRALVGLAEVLNREIPEYRITVQPATGAIITMKGYATGKFEGYYGADIGFYEYANDINRFKGFKASVKRPLVQSLWTYTIEVGTAVHSRDRAKYRGWSDLAGKSVFTGLLPWDVRAHLERAYGALGVQHQYRQVDLSAAGSLLQAGGLEGFIIYTAGESAPASWITEASLAADWAALNPSADELAALKKAGFTAIEVKPAVFRRDVHADKVILLPFYYGFHLGLDVPENDMYRMLVAIEKNAAAMAKTDASFAQIAQDMPGFQRRGVASSVDFVPVHPGLAKYMREKGVWDAKWDSRVAK
jgi:hypothetical protein